MGLRKRERKVKIKGNSSWKIPQKSKGSKVRKKHIFRKKKRDGEN